MTLTRSTLYTCTSITRILTETTAIAEDSSTVQSALLRHQSSCAWQCRGVSGIQSRGTRDLSSAASKRFQMVLGDTAGAPYALFLPWMLFGRPLLLAQCVDLDVVICTTRPSRTWSRDVGKFHRPLLKAVSHHRYIVPNVCSNPSVCHLASCCLQMLPRSNG